MNEAFGASPGHRCALGSVKTNVGHMDAAAGVTGLIKAVLTVERGVIPPSLGFEAPNPEIDFEAGPFFVNTEAREWIEEGPRRAGVSSFGLGGTNAHVVLEQAPERAVGSASRPWQLLPVSAASSAALDQVALRLAGHLDEKENDLADVAHTLRVGRRRLRRRRVIVARDRAGAAALLRGEEAEGEVLTGSAAEGRRQVAFLFSGVGDQYPGMARELYASEPTFRAAIDRGAEPLRELLGEDPRDLLFGKERTGEEPADNAATDAEAATGAGGKAGLDLKSLLGRGGASSATSRLDSTRLAQPLVFLVEQALVELWREWGIEPKACLGYSLGEYTAAWAAGVLSLEDALFLVAERARLIETLPEGAMLAVPLPEAELIPHLEASNLGAVGERGLGRAVLAATNGPAVCVAAGPAAAIDSLAARLLEEGILSQRLRTRHAFHSPAMEAIAPALREALAKVELKRPERPYLSNVSGTWIQPEEATDPEHWVRHLCGTVRFSEALGELLADQGLVLLEVGPGQALATAARQREDLPDGALVLASLRDARENRSDLAFLMSTVGRLWIGGVALDWQGFVGHEQRLRLPLPTYPFEGKRHWIEALERSHGGAAEIAADRAGGARAEAGDSGQFFLPVWKPAVRLPVIPEAGSTVAGRTWLLFHQGEPLSLALAAALRSHGQTVITAVPGESFAVLEPGAFALDPVAGEDYAALLDAVGPELGGILHLWTLGSGDGVLAEGEEDPATVAFWFERGAGSLAHLARALAPRLDQEKTDLVLLGSGLFDLPGAEGPSPGRAAAHGALLALPRELPSLHCRAVDVAVPELAGAATALSSALLAEILSGEAPAVAYRGHGRLLPELESLDLPTAPQSPSPFRQDGTYLITGGLGRLGLTFAEALGSRHGARLVLVGRTALPAEETWEAWLAEHGEEAPQSRSIRTLRRLRQDGVEIRVEAADAGDRQAMAGVLKRAREEFGPIHGVLHAAGAGDSRFLLGSDAESLEAVLDPTVMDPKVKGTLALAELLDQGEAGEDLDFFLLFSSVLGSAGAAGQLAQGTASAFLDAFASRRGRRAGSPTVAMGWDIWAPAPEAPGIQPAQGVQAVESLLSSGLSRALFSPFHLPTVLAERQEEQQETGPEQAAATLHSRPELSTDYAPPSSPTEEALAEIWCTLLGLEQVGVNDNFLELGGDSLLGLQVLGRVRQRLGLELTPQDLFDAPTVAALAKRAEALQQALVSEDLASDDLGDLEELSDLLDSIEDMSDEDLEMAMASDLEG